MRRGMPGLALLVQEGLKRDPHAVDVFVFRGRGGDLIKIIWHDGLGMSLYAKRLEKGRFIWPSPADGMVSISAAQLADITAKLKTAQQQWLKTRDADCAVEAFPATEGSKAFKIAQNDCVARMSDERSEFLESIGQE